MPDEDPEDYEERAMRQCYEAAENFLAMRVKMDGPYGHIKRAKRLHAELAQIFEEYEREHDRDLDAFESWGEDA